MALSDYGQALAYEAAFAFVTLEDPGISIDVMAELTQELSTKLRSLAVIELLVNASSDGFHHNLMRNGRVRLAFLRRLRDTGIRSHFHAVSGRYDQVIDLIAAGDFDTVDAIASLSPGDWQPTREYEEDFCYAQMLFCLSGNRGFGPQFDRLAQRFATALRGVADARGAVCLALAGRSQGDFESSFEELLSQRVATIEADKMRAQTITPEVTAMREVYVEGLAVLRLASMRGLVTQSEYAMCPSLARALVSKPLPD